MGPAMSWDDDYKTFIVCSSPSLQCGWLGWGQVILNRQRELPASPLAVPGRWRPAFSAQSHRPSAPKNQVQFRSISTRKRAKFAELINGNLLISLIEDCIRSRYPNTHKHIPPKRFVRETSGHNEYFNNVKSCNLFM